MAWGPLRRRAQAQQLAVDRSTPFGQSIVGLVNCVDGLDVIFGRRLTLSSGSTTSIPQNSLAVDDPQTGRARNTDTTHGIYNANRLDWPDWQLAAPLTFFAYWYITANALSTALDMGYSGGSDGYGIGERFGSGTRNYSAGGVAATGGAAWPQNVPISAAVTCDGATTTGYFNGVSDATAVSGALSYGSFARLYAGNQPDGHELTGGIWYMGIAKGLASPAQLRALAADPFSVYATARRATWLVSAASNNILAAPLGTLTLTGLVPTLTQGNSLTAPLGTLTLTGLVPTMTQGNSVTAPLGTLTLTGLAPTFSQPINLIAPMGTMTLTGLVPTFVQGGNQSITAPLGTMTLTGLVPTFNQTGGGGTIVVVGSGPGKKKRRHILEIDGELFEVRDIQHAEEILAQVRQLADENVARVAKAKAKPDLPKITTTLKAVQPQVDQTQEMIRQLYEAAAKGEEFLRELRLRDEDDDDAIAALL